MRAIDCRCGHHLEAANDEQMRDRSAAHAYDVARVAG